MNKTQIRKQNPHYNPFFLDGKEIRYLIFFKDGRELGRTRWFFSNNETPLLEFDFPIPLKRKLDLVTQGAFYIKAPSDCFDRTPYYNVYLHTNVVGFEALGEKVCYSSDTQITYIEHYRVRLSCVWTRVSSHVEEHTLEFTAPTVCRTEYTEEGKKINQLAAQFKEKNISISTYALTELFKHFEVTPRH